MTDIYDSKKRSQIMSKISGKETEPEIIVRKYLFSERFRYLKNDNRYPGTPDIVLPKHETIIFVHGCYWHGHECNKGSLPDTRREFWKQKISDNIKRDKKNQELLEQDGWKVVTLWECEIKNKSDRIERLEELTSQILS